MRHQKLHLVGQNAAVAQNEVFPQARHVRRVQERHMGLLGRAVAFAVVAGTAGGDHIHPAVDTILGEWNDVLAGQIFLMEPFTAVSADTAITDEQLVVGQTWFKEKGVDTWHAPGANNAVDRDDGLLASKRIVAAVKYGNPRTHFPPHFLSGVMNDCLLQRNPGLG